MNILFMVDRFYPDVSEDEARFVHKTSLALRRKGHNILIITKQYDRSLDEKIAYQGLNILRIPKDTAEKPRLLWDWISNHKKLLNSIDTIQIVDTAWWTFPVRMATQAPVYLTLSRPGRVEPTFLETVALKTATQLVRGVVSLGSHIDSWYQIKSNIQLVGATDQKLLEPGDKYRILVLGHLRSTKENTALLVTLQEIKAFEPKIKITFLGEGDLAWKAKDIGDVLGIHNDIQSHLQDAHWVFACSYLNMLDATVAGRSIFSTYHTPLQKEYLESYPLAHSIYFANSSHKLAKNFIQVFKNYKEHSLSISVSQHWAQNQSWDKIADHYLKLWSDNSYAFAYKHLVEDL